MQLEAAKILSRCRVGRAADHLIHAIWPAAMVFIVAGGIDRRGGHAAPQVLIAPRDDLNIYR